MNKIAIRVDSNEIIATGHIMRCITIARALRDRRTDVYFVSADDNTRPYLTAEDFSDRLHILNTSWDAMDTETDALISFLKGNDIGALFVDSYSVTDAYFEHIKDNGIKVVYIDDLCKHAFPVDALINYCPSAVTLGYEHLYGADTRLYLGASYIPLRKQFGEGLISHGDGLLVTAGGSDGMGLTDIIINGVIAERSLGYSESEHPRIHLLAGRYYKPSDSVLSAVDKGTVVLHQNVSDVAGLMSECEAAISSAGTTLFELCAVGVPTASFVFVDNQMIDAEYFDREGLMPYMGDFRVSSAWCMDNIIDFLYDMKSMGTDDKTLLSRRLQAVVDGRGAERVAELLTDI